MGKITQTDQKKKIIHTVVVDLTLKLLPYKTLRAHLQSWNTLATIQDTTETNIKWQSWGFTIITLHPLLLKTIESITQILMDLIIMRTVLVLMETNGPCGCLPSCVGFYSWDVIWQTVTKRTPPCWKKQPLKYHYEPLNSIL